MDSGEFTSLYRNHLPEITRFIARRVEVNQVEDLAADLFEVAWRKRKEIPEGFELPWLYKTARYLISNLRRKTDGRAQAIFLLREPEAAPSAESIALADLVLAEAWRRLSAKEQEILALFAWEGLDTASIAKVLNISVNACNVRLSRARQSLSAALQESDPKESQITL